MVKKLFKHEFLAWLRIMAIVWVVMLTVAVANRVYQLFENASNAYMVVFVLGIVAFVLTLTVCMSICEIFGVVRFYKNLFTGEGYLSFTLPVSTSAHIWVKALTFAAMMLLTLLVAGLSVLIVCSNEVMVEVYKAAAYLLAKLPAEARGHLTGYGIEMIVLLLTGCVFGPMLFYACICIGQLFRKHRVLGAIGVYFGYYYICQIFTSVLSFSLSFLEIEWLEKLETFPFGLFHGILCGLVVWNVLAGTVYFLICRHITTKKLNLE